MTPGQTLAQSFENCKLTAYPDEDGVWTVGWGHTGKDVYQGLDWTQAQADDAFLHDWSCAQILLAAYSPAIGAAPTGAEDALTDFVFNLGIGNYRTSTLRSLANADNWPEVKTELLKWDHAAGKVVPGLLRRRQSEADLIVA